MEDKKENKQPPKKPNDVANLGAMDHVRIREVDPKQGTEKELLSKRG